MSHAVCRHGDIRLLLAHPSRNERDRVSFCGEDDVPADGKNHGRVGATVAVEIFEENADASLEEGDLEEPQSQAWVEVEVLKTFHFLVCALFALSSLPMSVTVRPRLHPLASLSQIQSTPSAQDGVPHTIEEDLRAYGCKLIHQAGILLNQSVSFSSQFINPPHAPGNRKQVAVATAQILLQRFFYVSSLKQFSVAVRRHCCLPVLLHSYSSFRTSAWGHFTCRRSWRSVPSACVTS